MRLFLIRHGETVDNVAGNYAGITDSALTNHGVLQANRLGQHLAERGIVVTHIFSSDLQRAFKTAEAIRCAQTRQEHPRVPSKTVQCPDIREQDFGFMEGMSFQERPKDSSRSGKEAYLEAHRHDADFRDVESKDAMRLRANHFIDENLLALLEEASEKESVVVVAHGIILAHLWRCILKRFAPRSVTIDASVTSSGRELVLEYLGGWSNTGYLELEVRPQAETPVSLKRPRDEDEVLPGTDLAAPSKMPQDIDATFGPPPFTPARATTDTPLTSPSSKTPSATLDKALAVKAVNCLAHLKGVKKTRGGIGNLKHDEGQKTISSFFKKRKAE